MLFLPFLMECSEERVKGSLERAFVLLEKMITFVEIVKGNPGGSNNNNNNTTTCYLMITQNVTKQKKKQQKK